jgi:hypoxanthine phosphoribosyltransferase
MPAGSDSPGEVLVDRDAIQTEVARLAAQISADYGNRPAHLIGVLKGSAIFLSDLMRALTVPVTVDFISVVPYGPITASVVGPQDLDERSSGTLSWWGHLRGTLAYLLRNFQTRNPASSRVCALLAKQCARPDGLTLHYVGREIPDVFVVGYGLDKDERYRNLPYVARLGA